MIIRFWCIGCKQFFEAEQEEFGRWPKKRLYYAKCRCPYCGARASKILNRREANTIKYEEV